MLPQASCADCGDMTKRFEQICAREMFGQLRYVLSFPSRHKNGWPTELPLQIEAEDGLKIINLPIDDYPMVPISMPIFPMPGLLKLNDSASDLILEGLKFITPDIPFSEERFKRLWSKLDRPIRIPIPNPPIIQFAQMLAKIAYSYAVAMFGLENFVSELPGIIIGEDNRYSSFVGCPPEVPSSMISSDVEGKTHRFSHGICRINYRNEDGESGELCYIVVAIQLFQGIETPPYCVVVGIPNEELLKRLSDGTI